MRRGACLAILLCVVGCGADEGGSVDVSIPAPGVPPASCATSPDADGDGHPNVACGGDDCDDHDPTVHPEAPEGIWRREVVWSGYLDGGDGVSFVQSGVDRHGRSWVVYAVGVDDDLSARLVWTSGDGDARVEEEIRQTGFDGTIRAIAAASGGPDDRAVVSFHEEDEYESGHTYLASRDRPDAWSLEGVGDGAAYATAVSVDRAGVVDLLLETDVGIEAWTEEDGALDGPSLVSEAGQSPVLAVAVDGTRHALWMQGDRLVHASARRGGWTKEVVWTFETMPDPWEPPPSLAVDEGGAVFVTWRQPTQGIVLATRREGWDVEVVATVGVGPFVAASLGRTTLAYWVPDPADEYAYPSFTVATKTDEGWTTESPSGGFPRGVALRTDGTREVVVEDEESDEDDPEPVRHITRWINAPADGVDRDCDGADAPTQCRTDVDGDGDVSAACGGADCDDGDPDTRYGAPDPLGDARDTDCDGVDGVDGDRDGVASVDSGGADCDDRDPRTRPGVFDDLSDCLDRDCDGAGSADDDRDGEARDGCGGHDCDDGDPDAYSGAPEALRDGIDQDCDGVDGVDGDRDGWASLGTGGEDCNDARHGTHPGAPDGEPAWHLERPEDVEAADDATSLALDGGEPVIAYHALDPDEIRIARRAGRSWLAESVERVDGSSAYPALALDPGGVAHVLFRDGEADELRHATEAGGAWASESVDAVGTPGTFVAVVRDPAGAVHAVYMDVGEQDQLEHATNATGAWVVETVDDEGAVGHDCALAVDAGGALHASYAVLGDDDLRYATNASGTWTIETVDDGVERGHHSAIAVDASGTAHMVYREGGHEPGVPATMWYATNAGGAWALESVDDDFGAGMDAAIALDPDGFVHAVEIVNGALRVATNRSGAWETTDVAADNSASPSIAIDARGHAHVSYRRTDDRSLRYATQAPLPDGIDQNCDGVDGIDGDGDGHASVGSAGDDCDDAAPNTFPGAPDAPADGVDRDCDGND